MARPRLLLASLTILIALSASSATAGICPANQRFTGNLLPGSPVTIDVSLPVTGDTTYHFIPRICIPEFTLRVVGGNSQSGNCGLAVSRMQAPAGSYQVELSGSFLGVEDTAAMPFQLIIYQSNCS